MIVTGLMLALLVSASAGSLHYDQTQTGDTNIHLQIKNVEVLALLDDAAGAEYDYDYNEFTEKPLKPGTTPNVTFPTSHPPAVNNTTTTAAAAVTTDYVSTTNTPEQPLLSSTAAPASSTTKKTRRCGAGFYRDTLGRCRRVRRPHLQTLMKLMSVKTTEMSKTS